MKRSVLSSIFLMGIMFMLGCDRENALSVTPVSFEFDEEGGAGSIIIETDADSWNITNPAPDWLILSDSMGNKAKALVSVVVNTRTAQPRSTTLLINAGNAEPAEVNVTQASSEYLYSITCNIVALYFKRGGESKSLSFSTGAPEWSICCEAEWVQFSESSGSNGSSNISVTALENEGVDDRSAQVTISAEYTPDYQFTIEQKGEYYPSYNISPLPPDLSGMTRTASELAEDIVLGWNIGNTLEALGGETAWGNPRITQSLIQLIKENGFNAVRIPCSFNQYMQYPSTAKIKTEWLNRVKEVIQYCMNEDMYVILNIHWDGGWLENNCTSNMEESVAAKQKAFWEQIATHLRDFDEHLLFASANEPNVSNSTQMAILKTYHQTFIDAVRSTGGRNSYRVLVIQGPNTDIEMTNKLMNSLPDDNIPNRMMVEIHYYTPWNFCGMEKDESWGDMFYYWGKGYHSTTDPGRNATWGEEDMVDDLFESMETKFVSKGIPVVLGEYSVTRRSSLTGENLVNHLASRAYYYYYVTRQAKANGMIPFYWDNGYTGNLGSGIFNRNTNSVFDQQALDALNEGAGE